MGLLDNIRLAFASLWAGKLRALLTMLGIIIGIGSVIAILTVGDSLTGSINDSMQGLGVSNITVSLTEKVMMRPKAPTPRGFPPEFSAPVSRRTRT